MSIPFVKGQEEQSQQEDIPHYNPGAAQAATFDIRDHLDKLEAVNETRTRYECVCPICQDDNLKIEKANGKYQCFSTGCEIRDIREAISPWEERAKRPPRNRRVIPFSPPKAKPVPVPSSLKLAKLPEVATDSPQPRRNWSQRDKEVWETIYSYGTDQWVVRSQLGNGKKNCYQWHRDENGEVIAKKGPKPWKPYRFDEAIQAAKQSKATAILGGEGEKCVEIARASVGLATVTLQGASWGKEDLRRFAQSLKDEGLSLVYLPDNDVAGRKKAEDLEEACNAVGVFCLVVDPLAICNDLEESGDIEQILMTMDAKEFIERLEAEIHSSLNAKQEAARAVAAEVVGDFDGEKKTPPLAKLLREVRQVIGHRLKLNTLKQEIEFDGQPVDFDDLRIQLAEEHGINGPRLDCVDVIKRLAKDNAYSPVLSYLNRVYEEYRGEGTDILNGIASEYLGTTEKLPDIYLRKWFISAVARAMDPGCKVDTCLFLQGKQGWRKSSFFQELLPAPDWFCDTMGDTANKDEQLKMHRAWLIEWAELETIFGKRETSQIKSFLTSRSDSIRLPYARTTQDFKRQSVIVGTTNSDDFLTDPTGSRRFWVVEVQKPIDIAKVRENRDRLWAAAVAAYKSGQIWWLTEEEQELSSERNRDYASAHPWLEEVANLVSGRSEVTTKELLDKIKPDLAQQKRVDSMDIAACLKNLGWKKEKPRREAGKLIRPWSAPDDLRCNLLQPVATSDRLGSNSRNPVPEEVSTTVATCCYLNDQKSIFNNQETTSPGNVDPVVNKEIVGKKVATGCNSSEIPTEQELQVLQPTGEEVATEVATVVETLSESRNLKVGDRVHYLGAEPSLAQLCDSRLLTVRAIDVDMAMVKADTRDIQQPIPLGDLSDPR